MKKSQLKDLKSKEAPELRKLLAGHLSDLDRIMVDLRSGKLKNTALPVSKRKAVAVILTLLKERKMLKS